jgi:mono/diheme cytochrome c family protein
VELDLALEGDLLMDSGKLRKYFAGLSVLFLFILAFSPFKDYFREWKLYQYRYNMLVADLPQKVAPAEIGIKQIWNQKLDRVDRCITCHQGLKVEGLANAPQPYRTHPHMYHDVAECGCTICHDGQGPATEYKESVGLVKFWDKPIIPRQYMEASCGKCHKESDVPQAPALTEGRKLIKEMNCVGCHKIEGYEKQWVPHLDGVGRKVNRGWLVSWLKNPKGYFDKTKMPNFMLADSDITDLADFLLADTLFANNTTLEPLPATLTSANDAEKAKLVELGSTRFKEARCISCHAINGKGGYVATDLGKIASKASEQWLYNYIKHPKEFSPDVEMPRFRFTPQDLTAVVAYMESEFVDYDATPAEPHTPGVDSYEKGLALFKKNNCSGCHQLGTMTKAEEMGPDLTSVGSKKTYEIEFGKSGIEETLPSYLRTKITNPRVFASTLRMPNFGFNEEQARSVTTALLANRSENIPADLIVAAEPRSTFAPQGEFGKLVKDLACLGCHKMEGKGRLVATDLSMEGSIAQKKWIEGYFKVPYSIRPILTERMPNLYLSDAEINTIVDYFEKVFVVDSIDHDVKMDLETVAKGKGLFYEKYGCQSCHQVDTKGGYVGPPLDKLAERLQPGWVFHWLKNPQAYKPGSIEPNNHLSDDDADALTAYLMTLK